MKAALKHYWTHKKIGMIWSYTESCPMNNHKERGCKYVGFSYDEVFPKKMNTGRIFYEPKKKLSKRSKN